MTTLQKVCSLLSPRILLLLGCVGIIISLFLTRSTERALVIPPLSVPYIQERLQRDMARENIIAIFGRPLEERYDIAHTYLYELRDGTRILLSQESGRLTSARHIDQNGHDIDPAIVLPD